MLSNRCLLNPQIQPLLSLTPTSRLVPLSPPHPKSTNVLKLTLYTVLEPTYTSDYSNNNLNQKPSNDIAKTQYGFNPFKNVHSHAIVGSNLQTCDLQPDATKVKENQQKLYQEELQRQIRERDEIRKREEDMKHRRPASLNRRVTNEFGTGHFGQEQARLAAAEE